MDIAMVNHPSTEFNGSANTSRTSSGFQTFLMTGDAIIHTNFSSKPPKKLNPRENEVTAAVNEEMQSHSKGHTADTNGTTDQGNAQVADSDLHLAPPCYPSTKLEGKEFIPGFMHVENEQRTDNEQSSYGNLSPDDENLDSIDINLEMTSSRISATVDQPSAVRLAKRLFTLDGFKRSDVSRHLNKNSDLQWLEYLQPGETVCNDFSQKVAEEFLKYFDFTSLGLVDAMRKFFDHFTLIGETQERERVLRHFTRRYLDCNPQLSQIYISEDDCHTLVCAVMLLNSDQHGQNIGKKMTLGDFVENLSGLNGGKDFPKDLLKTCYSAIKQERLKWAIDDEADDNSSALQPHDNGLMTTMPQDITLANPPLESTELHNQILSIPTFEPTVYKEGCLNRKHCKGLDGVDTIDCCHMLPCIDCCAPSGKRGWRKCYVILKDMILYMMKSEKSTLKDPSTKVLHIHHSLAAVARDYKKKKFVFSLITADWSQYLFSTSDATELEDWVNTINLVTATYSSEPLAAAVGSQKKFHRPLLPSSHTKHHLGDQCRLHEAKLEELVKELHEHESDRPKRNVKKDVIQNYKDKLKYLQYERQRYMVYAQLLRSQLNQFPQLELNIVNSAIGEVDEPQGTPRMAQHISLELRGPANSVENDQQHQPTGSGMYVNEETTTTRL